MVFFQANPYSRKETSTTSNTNLSPFNLTKKIRVQQIINRNSIQLSTLAEYNAHMPLNNDPKKKERRFFYPFFLYITCFSVYSFFPRTNNNQGPSYYSHVPSQPTKKNEEKKYMFPGAIERQGTAARPEQSQLTACCVSNENYYGRVKAKW